MPNFLTPKYQLMKRQKINLGCGNDIRNNWINIDAFPLDGVDVTMDIEKDKIPFPDKSISIILVSHVLEHIINLKFVLTEISRVLMPGGKFYVIVPAFSSSGAFQDPTHVRFFTELTFKYISGDVFDYYYEDLNLDLISVKKQRTDFYFQLLKYFRPFYFLLGKNRFDNYVNNLFWNTVAAYYVIFEKRCK